MVTRPRIGLTHNLPPELRPAPRRIAPQPRATGYAAPGLVSVVVRVLRRLINTKGSL